MAAVAAMQQQDVDIDPGWYAGQPETASSSAPATGMPTVLTKLQKWGDYPGYGEPVWPTKFVPMKTPLSVEILDHWHLPSPPRYRLTVQDLIATQQAAGRRIGLMLDLSNHDCLYASDIPADVQYLHVQLVAKELPPLEYVHEVGRAASSYWASHSDDYIAIHCAYGFNRTGFVVCSYLIEWCGLSVEQALASFARSRPPGVKHEKFRDELHARYGGRNQAIPCCITASDDSSAHSSGMSLPQSAGSCSAVFRDSVDAASVAGSSSNSLRSSCTAAAAGSRVLPLAELAAAAVAAAEVPRESQSTCGGGSSSCFSQRPPVPVAQQTFFCCSGGSSSTPPPPPVPAAAAIALTPTSSRAILSSSPLPRLSMRCYSSGSVGDNSSIGCSPDPAAEFLLQGTSIHSNISSTTPLASSHGNSSSIGTQQQQQQQPHASWLGQMANANKSTSSSEQPAEPGPRGHNSSGAHSTAAAGAAGMLGQQQQQQQQQQQEEHEARQGCCSAGDTEQEPDEDDGDDADAAAATDDDADCFDLDPCGEPRGWTARSRPGGNANGGSGSCCCSNASSCREAGGSCCNCRQSHAPGAAEITSLLSGVQLGQQQQL